jgi:hypothetical protein
VKQRTIEAEKADGHLTTREIVRHVNSSSGAPPCEEERPLCEAIIRAQFLAALQMNFAWL